jgi:Na+-translocating ferredoxin:NAD+ oxidoreductase subunit D
MNLLTISGSPHNQSNLTVSKIMWGVVLALMPAFLISVWYFGVGAIITIAIAVISCVATEYLGTRYILNQKPTLQDGSAVVTGILLAFNLPSNLPWWQVIIGSVFAIAVVKLSFGGLGKNPFNPALAGRVFMLISFPVDMTSWPLPVQNRFLVADAITGPTSLGLVKEGLKNGEAMDKIMGQIDYLNLSLGNIGGSLGEVSAIALILGGLYLLFRKIITWHIPVSYLLTVVLFAGILWLIDPGMFVNPLFHLLTGGLLLGAIFMATDMVTSPMTPAGMLIFGLGCGILTVLIRVWGAYPEGVSFAILLMNAVTPLLNKGIKPKRFGEKIKTK